MYILIDPKKFHFDTIALESETRNLARRKYIYVVLRTWCQQFTYLLILTLV